MTSRKRILFEPWALGDALIAASVLALRPGEFVLACQEKWHPIIMEALPGATPSDLIAIRASYEPKGGNGLGGSIDPRCREFDGAEVFSIRGDLRDYYLARTSFAKSKVRMNGWLPFLARKLPLLDLPFRHGLFRVKNRYRMWTDLLGIDPRELERLYAPRRRPRTGKAAIHVGAQWRSKQFPEVQRLAALLAERGLTVEILAGEGDPLPEGVAAAQVQVVMGRALASRLKAYDFVVSNDSGPMHLAALLGVPTVAVGRSSNIDCWAPPSVLTVASEKMPKGYAPARGYWSGQGVAGWPAPDRIVARLVEGKLL
jgi:hypothetical protein